MIFYINIFFRGFKMRIKFLKSHVRCINKIRTRKIMKEIYTDKHLEIMRGVALRKPPLFLKKLGLLI